jgi:hypothetical protein
MLLQAASTGGAVVDEFAGAGGDAQLVAGVAAVSGLRAERRDQAGFADGAQEALGGAEYPGGPAHGVGGNVIRHRVEREVASSSTTS